MLSDLKRINSIMYKIIRKIIRKVKFRIRNPVRNIMLILTLRPKSKLHQYV